MKRTVTVLQEDIDNGAAASVGHCPIALAVRREWDVAVQVGCMTLSVRDGDVCHRADLPVEAQWFVSRFDHEQAVEPFKFEVELEAL